MEYSLQHLNKIGSLRNLDLNTFIETLNLIGLEIDEVNIETKQLISDIKLLIKIPANRDDLLNETLFIEELSSIFLFQNVRVWENFQKKYFFLLKQNYSKYSNYSLKYINSDVPHYITYVVTIEKYKPKVIPSWISNKLKISSLNNLTLIDSLINLSLLEWGQNFNRFPDGLDLKVERLENKQTYKLKDNIYTLGKGTITLKNTKNEIISVLGIINESLNHDSFSIEANFYDIDKNLLLLNDVNTKLSYRHLRRSFLNNFKFAFQRLLTLIEIIAEGEINSNIYKTKPQIIELNSYQLLKIDKNSFKKFLNIDTYDEKIFEKNSLKIVCKTPESLYLRIPNSRKDLTREIDLIEEYCKFIGYKNFPEIFPEILTTKKIKTKTKKINFIKQFFLNADFNEVFSNSLISEQKLTKNSIILQNPLNSDLSLLRYSLIPNLIEILIKNIRFGIYSLPFFEIGRIYKNEDNKIIEEEYLSAIFPVKQLDFGQEIDFFIAKGFIENFLASFTNKNFVFETIDELNPYYHPNKFLKITENNKTVGYFGEIHPKYKKFLSFKQHIYLFEFNLDSLTSKNLKSNIKIYKEYSKYPLIIKDLSIIISKDINFYFLKDDILKEIKDLKNVNFFDIYFDENSSEKISLGIRLSFQSFTKTLINEAIEIEIEKIKILLNKNFNAQLKA